MLFNSFVFLVFAAVFYLLWPLFRQRSNRRWAFLSIASFIFYGWWDWRFLFLLMAIGLLDFLGALGIQRFPRFRKGFLFGSLGANLGVLFLFKYLGFFLENTSSLASMLGLEVHFEVAPMLLPLGISFYTFESMSYVIEVYKGELKPTRNLLHYFAFLSLFPHLIAGPIIRAADLLPQLETWRKPDEAGRWEALRLVAFGFFKKVALADNLAPAVNTAFGSAGIEPSMPYWWVIMGMFAFQIYCDFSGYSDIARGLARWMGYQLPLNFDHPYTATSFRDFWRRWHISLSTWFRDYVYIPLGGSRGGLYAGILAMSATMLISGFWHGAAWTFVAWGGLHALYLAVERLTDWPRRLAAIPGGVHLGALLVLGQVWIAWVFFRATSWAQATGIVGEMLNFSHGSLEPLMAYRKTAIPFLLLAIGIELFFYLGLHRLDWSRTRWLAYAEAAAVVLMLVLSVYSRGPGGAFIYFQF